MMLIDLRITGVRLLSCFPLYNSGSLVELMKHKTAGSACKYALAALSHSNISIYSGISYIFPIQEIKIVVQVPSHGEWAVVLCCALARSRLLLTKGTYPMHWAAFAVVA